MNLGRANFEDLVAKYYSGTAAHAAAVYLAKLIDDQKNDQLARLLRDFRDDR